MIELDVWSTQSVVKVDDTTGGIEAGLVAGCWTVGIAKTGNYVGMTESEMEAADPVLLKAKAILKKAGAHFVIETTNDLPDVIVEINRRLKSGLKSVKASTHMGLLGVSRTMAASPDLMNLGLFSVDLPVRRSTFSLISANLQAM